MIFFFNTPTCFSQGYCKIAFYWWIPSSFRSPENWTYIDGMEFDISNFAILHLSGLVLLRFFFFWLCIFVYAFTCWLTSAISLKEDEVRRNSVMFDMLFVKLCHPLSVCISILEEKYKRLTDRERAEVKERIDPVKRFVVVSKFYSVNFSSSSKLKNKSISTLRPGCRILLYFIL